METIKFQGLINKLVENNLISESDINDCISNELNISPKKASFIARKIKRNFKIKSLVKARTILEESKADNSNETHECPTLHEGGVSIYDVDMLSGCDFEVFLKVLFERLGYSAQAVGKSGDYGVDLILRSGKTKIAVQAKRYDPSSSVGNTTVEKVHSGMKITDCKKSMVVTTSYFTKAAKYAAKKLKVELWNRNDLIEKLSTTFNQTNHTTDTPKFPQISHYVFEFLFEIDKMRSFKITEGANNKFTIKRVGTRHPLIIFYTQNQDVKKLVLTMNGDTPVKEAEGEKLIWSDRSFTYGDSGNDTCEKIIEYLERFC